MIDRRHFLSQSALAFAFAGTAPAFGKSRSGACVVSTWDFGVAANQEAWKILAAGGRALDAVEAGARVPEVDLANHSVGKAGYPDRDGHVSLDASIMDEQGNCGAVAALEHISHPISVARRVMEQTPHVLLVGEGALQFALEQGFPREELLTPESEQAWQDWRKTAHYQPQINGEMRSYSGPSKLPGDAGNHDTIGILALDRAGHLSGACTTSGMAWKMRGRVGDSPIIGAGLYVDDQVGAATSSGVGEEVIRNVGSFLVVELMRRGHSPGRACEMAVRRIAARRPEASKGLQVGFLALNRKGEVGAFALQKGFVYAYCDGEDRHPVVAANSLYQTEIK